MGSRDFSVDEGWGRRCEPERPKCHEECHHKRIIEVEEVLGTGEGNTNFEVKIPVIPPGFEVLINQIERTIVFDALVAAEDKVFINARLIKNIPFKTQERCVQVRCSDISRLTIGSIRHVTAEVPFFICIRVPGSQRGARVKVIESNIDSVELPNSICAGSRAIVSITEKDCVFIRVRVVRDITINAPEEC